MPSLFCHPIFFFLIYFKTPQITQLNRNAAQNFDEGEIEPTSTKITRILATLIF